MIRRAAGGETKLIITLNADMSAISKTEVEDVSTGEVYEVVIDWEQFKTLLPRSGALRVASEAAGSLSVLPQESSGLPASIIIVGGTVIMEPQQRRKITSAALNRTGPIWDRPVTAREDLNETEEEAEPSPGGGEGKPPKV